MNRTMLLVLALQLAFPAGAQTLTWTKTGGPLGGLGYNVRVHPTNKNLMYVTDAWSGVNRSEDGGVTWRASNTGITIRVGPSNDAIPVFSLTIDQSNPDVLWVGTQGVRGIFKSTDGGTTWKKSDNGISENNGLTIRNFQIDPSNSNTVYASAEVSTGIQGKEFERVQGALYKTVDGGANWSRIWLGDSLARWLVIDPDNSKKIVMATGIFDREAVNVTGVGLLQTLDGGTTWAPINQGLTSLFVGGMLMHPNQASTYVIATGANFENNAATYGGVHLSTNSGATWTRVLAPHDPGSAGSQDNVFTAVAFAPSNPRVLYAGNAFAFYRSADGGLSWTRYVGESGLQYGPKGVRAGVPIEITVDTDDENTVYVNNYGGGVFKSTDGAQTWRVWSKGYTGADIHSIAVSAQNPAQLLVIGRSGPFTTTDAGHQWNGVLNGTAFQGEGGEWYSAAIHPADPNVMLIGDEHQGAIFRSSDGGASWTLALRHPMANSVQYGRQGIQSIQFAPSHPQTVYAGFASASFFSNPSGAEPNTSFGVYRSDDGGANWSARNNGLSSTNLNVSAVAVSASNAAVVYAGMRSAGVYKSIDSGDQWTDVSSNLPTTRVTAVALSPTDSSTVYVGTGDQGVYKSVNGGASWSQVLAATASGDTPARKVIMAVVVDPQNASTLYVADWNSGVFRSTDAGQTWQQINTGLTTRAVESLALSQDGRSLYAGTKGEGVFRVDTRTGGDIALTSNGTMLPDPPTIRGISSGAGIAEIAFSPAAGNGAGLVNSYTATCSANGQASKSASGSGSPVTVTGLTGGVFYTCSVAANNAAGSSGASVPLLARPSGDPAYASVLQRVYVAYFGRPADPAGLAYFANMYAAAAAPTEISALSRAYATNPTLRSLIDSFGTSAESQALYPGDNNAFVNAIYVNLFNRSAEAAGRDYWADLINRGSMTRANAALSIMAGARDSDLAIINNKAAVASSFVASINSTQLAAAYSGLSANVVVRTMLSTVTQTTDATAFQATINATLKKLLGAAQ